MRCPICRKRITWKGNPFRPFCSERCKLIDLDNWFSGRYRIPDPGEVQKKSDMPASAVQDAKRNRD